MVVAVVHTNEFRKEEFGQMGAPAERGTRKNKHLSNLMYFSMEAYFGYHGQLQMAINGLLTGINGLFMVGNRLMDANVACQC